MTVEVYSDVVCPWCYIGERRLRQAVAALPDGRGVTVRFMPFQLDPATPDAAVPVRQYLKRRFGPGMAQRLEHVTAVARQEGVSLDWDRARIANTATAHRLLTWVQQEYGDAVQNAVVEQLFELYFTRGGDIGDVADLADAAGRGGVDAARAAAHLTSGDGRAELDAAFAEARRRGIRAVPTFVVDGRIVGEGAQPVADLVDLLEQALAASAR